ncbi:hypothetical protein HMPREF0551_1133 [Lautropia mirabilis ATCC 51599]|uniref:Uncharacterized protein n=1 Tax=Lautropia mirabilis ATCC 51599 TaxID=887898 RepID=E7RWS1_9BURK|nr:hypothetical protein HMPREF0551_1133 [Lautropia mirabilis ATCC 51599]
MQHGEGLFEYLSVAFANANVTSCPVSCWCGEQGMSGIHPSMRGLSGIREADRVHFSGE